MSVKNNGVPIDTLPTNAELSEDIRLLHESIRDTMASITWIKSGVPKEVKSDCIEMCMDRIDSRYTNRYGKKDD